ncbi:conserved hypothetical protein [uncultured Desulfobacterium sp.]|uniref:Cobalamin-independent methionine synthase MetE C-terminal/archaeal domain-containing protein n=1 Tax=uncultured Desulfobacterium sp. TaxID=201089 RepID=A0A445MUR2_9BACT|nr:conserved hypothetical protein [uncultured Desulfobacterium sp.]
MDKIAEFSPGGIATGIGSLPFTDPDEAVGFVIRYFSRAPHWPQMPRRGSEEYFVFQFLQPLVDSGLLIVKGDSYFFDASRPDWPERLTDFYSICLAAESGDALALAKFLPPVRAARGFHAFLAHLEKMDFDNVLFVKGQIAGPLTVGLNLKDQEGRFSYYNDELRDVIVRTLALNSRSQARALSQFGRQAVIFVDEPAVSAYGTRDHLTMTKEMIIEDINAIFRAVFLENALTGVHACEAIDWSILLETHMQILSLDAYRFGQSLGYYLQQVNDFLNRGGSVAWGIVPTLDDPFKETPDSLLDRLKGLLSQLVCCGPDIDLVIRQSLITPACGAGLLSVDWTQRIYGLANAVSARIGEPKW